MPRGDAAFAGRNAQRSADSLLIEVCQAMVAGLDASNRSNSQHKLTQRQAQIAIDAGKFLAACATVGLDALVDEATGYQDDRVEDALQVGHADLSLDGLRQGDA
jgi:hypothetical protein